MTSPDSPTAPDDDRTTLRDLHVDAVWQVLSAADADALVRFWIEEKAIVDPAEARRRVREVVCLARDAAGRIAGVSTVYPGQLNQSGTPEPYWFYRSFIRPDCRVYGLASRILHLSFQTLARAGGGMRGVAVVTENPGLMSPALRKHLVKLGLTRIGVTPAGLDVWKRDFGPAH